MIRGDYMKKGLLVSIFMVVGVLCIVVAITLSAFDVGEKVKEPKLTTTEMVNQAIDLLEDNSDYTEEDLIFSEINDDNDVVFNVKAEDDLSLIIDIKTGDYYFISTRVFDSTTDAIEEE